MTTATSKTQAKGIRVTSSKKNPFQARLVLDKSNNLNKNVWITIGSFPTLEEATKARAKYIKSLI